MTGKEYLSQSFFVDREIENKIEEVNSLRALAEKCTATLSDMSQAPSRDVHKREAVICKIIDFENEIINRMDELVDIKREIHGVIEQIENREYRMLLELRYIHFYDWKEIADEMGCTERWIYRIHGIALKEIEKKLHEFSKVH